MFGWEFPPYMSGGLGTACLGMTRALVDDRVEVLFVMPGLENPLDDRFLRFISPDLFSVPEDSGKEDEPGQAMTRFIVDSPLTPYENDRTYGNRYRTGKTGILSGLGAYGISSFVPYGSDLFSEVKRYSQAAEPIARSEVFDIIHSHDWMTVQAALKAREISGKPWIFHVHSLEYDRSGEAINQGIFEMERHGLMEADHIIAVSDYTRKRIVEYYGISADKITVVHNGVFNHDVPDPLAESRVQGNEKNVLFLGRITFQKGPDYFIEAAAEVLKRMPDVTFIMAGSGDMMPGMIEKVAELGIGRHFHFTGFLRDEDVERVFRMSNLYVMPSVSEPFGISPLEATRYGVPVIMSRQSGVAEILHHCLLVDFWDVRDMADKMTALLGREPLVRELKTRAREELFKAGWNEAARKIQAVYKKVMN
jgi:glycosyltransferase involved in cell wall biosynthesis